MNIETDYYSKLFRTTREKLGYSQEEIASFLRISVEEYRMYEDGKKPFPETIVNRLCYFFEYDINQVRQYVAELKEKNLPLKDKIIKKLKMAALYIGVILLMILFASIRLPGDNKPHDDRSYEVYIDNQVYESESITTNEGKIHFDWEYPDSTAIDRYGVNYSKSMLAIMFTSNDNYYYVYTIKNTSVIQHFEKVESKGSYYNDYIKGQYPCEKVRAY